MDSLSVIFSIGASLVVIITGIVTVVKWPPAHKAAQWVYWQTLGRPVAQLDERVGVLVEVLKHEETLSEQRLAEVDQKIADALSALTPLKQQVAALEKDYSDLIDNVRETTIALTQAEKASEGLRAYVNSLLTIKDGDKTTTATMENVREWVDRVQHQLDVVRDMNLHQYNSLNETLVNVTHGFGPLEGRVSRLEKKVDPPLEAPATDIRASVSAAVPRFGDRVEVTDGAFRKQQGTVIELRGGGIVLMKLDHHVLSPARPGQERRQVTQVELGPGEYRVL